eukprot:COSAG01_NODE_4863_length_4674_cov_3.016175_1_plen_62_part_10
MLQAHPIKKAHEMAREKTMPTTLRMSDITMVLRSNERVLTKKVDSFPLSSSLVSFHIHGLRL